MSIQVRSWCPLVQSQGRRWCTSHQEHLFSSAVSSQSILCITSHNDRSHQSHDITCRCCKCHLEYSNMLDYAVQIPDTVNRMEHPLAVLFMPLKLMPLKHSLSCLRGFTTSCHPWCKSVTSNKNEREARRGVRASNCELELPPKGSVLSWQNSRWRHLLFSLPPFTPNPYIYIGQTAAKVAAQPNQDARLPIGELWWCITHPFDGHT